jgi:SlyX protein
MIAFRAMTPETLEQIETKIAFLERANAELSDVVYAQRRELDEMQARLSGLSKRLDSSQPDGATPYSLEDEKPPHY